MDVNTLMARGRAPLLPKPGVDLADQAARDAAARDPSDPPIFVLQASPAFAPWLSDTMIQRVQIGPVGSVLTVQGDGSIAWASNPSGFVNPLTTAGDMIIENAIPATIRLPVGTAGQVLTVVGGLPAWANAVTGFINPMSALGDLITGAAGGAPGRLAVGTAGQVLTVSGGVPAWANSAAGFANPMTTAGDLLFENATPAPARLAIGTAGQVLTVVGGLPAWSASSAGLTNPMTTAGDLITGAGGGTPQRLAAGANGQVLGVSAGVPTWINSPSGFGNPMTTLGDMITGASGGVAQRLAVGAAGQALMVNPAGTAEAWTTQPWQIVQPSGDVTGATDLANLNAAFALLGNVGIVWLIPGATYYIPAAGLVLPPYVSLIGHRTILNYVGGGTGTAVLWYNSADPQTYTRLTGMLWGIIVDGTSAGNGAIGIQLQDMNGVWINVTARNFTGTGSFGYQFANNAHSMNDVIGFCRAENNTNAVSFTALGAQNAIEHVMLHFSIDALGTLQNGFVLANSVGIQGSDIKAFIGTHPGSGTAFTFGSGCVFSDCHFVFKCECTAAATTATTASFSGGGSGFVRCHGSLFFSSNMITSNIGSAGGVVGWFGPIINESTMVAKATVPPGLGTYDGVTIAAPAFPGASGTAVTNNTSVPVVVTVAGGTLNGAFGQVNGVTVGDASTRIFFVPRGQAITLNWSAAPSGWTWQPIG